MFLTLTCQAETNRNPEAVEYMMETNRWWADLGYMFKVMPYWNRHHIAFATKEEETGKWKQAWLNNTFHLCILIFLNAY